MFDFLKILGKEKGYISSTFLELKMHFKANFVEEKTIKSFGNGTGHIFEYNNAYF